MTQKVNCVSVVSGTYGERLFDHIVFEGDGFNVGNDFFDVRTLGKVQTEKVSTYKGDRSGLTSFNLYNVDYRGVIPRTIELENGTKIKTAALVFIRGPKPKHLNGPNKNRLRTNLRNPMSIEYWREISRIERMEDHSRIRTEKEELKKDYGFDYLLEDKGSQIILPHKTKDASSYLVAMSAGSSFEWVLSRKSRNLPNCYRLDCDSEGKVTLHDPRKEARQVIR